MGSCHIRRLRHRRLIQPEVQSVQSEEGASVTLYWDREDLVKDMDMDLDLDLHLWRIRP